MGKRIMLSGVGAAVGVLLGVMVDVLGAGTGALMVGAALGAFVPLLVLGKPGK